MAAYGTIDGSFRRDGRVDAPARTWRHFERIVLSGPVGEAYMGSPRAVLVDADGLRRAIVYEEYLILVEPYGARVIPGPGRALCGALLERQGLVYGATRYGFDGTQTRLDRSGLHDEGATHLAVLATDAAFATVVLSRPSWSGPKFAVRFRSGEGLVQFRRTEEGTGALGGPRHAFVAVAGELRRVAANGAQLEEHVLANDVPPTVDVAAIEDRAVATCPRLHELRDYGHNAQRVQLGFAPSQPPLDGGGQLYACGRGIAAVAEGRLRWQKPANLPLFATSLGPAGVVVAGGRMLRHYDRDGRSLTELTTPDGSRFCTPPAPSPSGTLHVGTTSGAFAIH